MIVVITTPRCLQKIKRKPVDTSLQPLNNSGEELRLGLILLFLPLDGQRIRLDLPQTAFNLFRLNLNLRQIKPHLV